MLHHNFNHQHKEIYRSKAHPRQMLLVNVVLLLEFGDVVFLFPIEHAAHIVGELTGDLTAARS